MKEQSLTEDPVIVPLYTAHVDRYDECYRARCLDFPRAEGYGDSPENARYSLMCD
jgi:hypothetical protein